MENKLTVIVLSITDRQWVREENSWFREREGEIFAMLEERNKGYVRSRSLVPSYPPVL